MVSERKDIISFIPLTNIVRRAVLDMYADFSKDQARYQAWAIDGLKKLTREVLKSGKRYAVININKNLNSAILPCDFKEEIFVGLIDNCGEKIELNINPNIVDNFLLENEVPCDQPCIAKCNCFPKQLCNDLQTTQVINKVLINDVLYDQTVTTTLLPNGEYYQVTTTPVFNTVTSTIDYLDKKEYITTFDTSTCGCIKPTESNKAKLEVCNWDLWCCYCSPCKTTNTDHGGYKIFYETGTIHFDGAMVYDKFYLEYRGTLPKSGNEYLVPEVAYETLINFVKFKSVENKRGIGLGDRQWHFDQYTRERTNMTKIMGRMSLSDVIQSAMLVPKFAIHSNGCYRPATVSSGGGANQPPAQVVVTNTQYVPVPSPPLPQFPTIITFDGSQAINGQVYNNAILAGVTSMRVFANPFNRFLTPSEFIIIPTGGVDLSPLGTNYTSLDVFDIFPRWTN